MNLLQMSANTLIGFAEGQKYLAQSEECIRAQSNSILRVNRAIFTEMINRNIARLLQSFHK